MPCGLPPPTITKFENGSTVFVWDDGRRLENAANGDQIFTNLDGRTVVTKAKSPPAVAAAVPVRAPCEDEAGTVATNEAGKQLTCAEAKVHCSNVQLAKCKRLAACVQQKRLLLLEAFFSQKSIGPRALHFDGLYAVPMQFLMSGA